MFFASQHNLFHAMLPDRAKGLLPSPESFVSRAVATTGKRREKKRAMVCGAAGEAGRGGGGGMIVCLDTVSMKTSFLFFSYRVLIVTK